MASWERFEPHTAPVQAECSNHYAMLPIWDVLVLLSIDSSNHCLYFWLSRGIPRKSSMTILGPTLFNFPALLTCFKVCQPFLIWFSKFLTAMFLQRCFASLLLATFVTLIAKFVKILAAVWCLEILQLSLSISSNYKWSWDVINFIGFLMQNNFCNVINCKLSSSPDVIWKAIIRSDYGRLQQKSYR